MNRQAQLKQRWLQLKKLRLFLFTAWFALHVVLLGSPGSHIFIGISQLYFVLFVGALVVGGVELWARKKAGERRRFLLPQDASSQEEKGQAPRW